MINANASAILAFPCGKSHNLILSASTSSIITALVHTQPKYNYNYFVVMISYVQPVFVFNLIFQLALVHF